MLSRPLTWLLAAASVLAAPAAAGAAPTAGPAFAVSGVPQHVVGTPDGGAWVALDGSGSGAEDLARVEPDGAVTNYASPDITGVKGITVGPDGMLWMTGTGVIGRASRFAPAVVNPIAVAGLNPQSIVAGPDGNLWTASGAKVYRVTPAGVLTAFTVAGIDARGIAAGKDALYVADTLGGNLVKVTTDGTATKTPIANGAGMQEVAVDGAGRIALTEPVNAPTGVTILPATFAALGGDQTGIVAAPDGAFWTAGFASEGLTRTAPDGTTSTLALGAGLGPRQLATAGLGRLWVSLETARKVQRVDGVEAPVAIPPAAPPVVTPTPPPATQLPSTAFTLTLERVTHRRRREARVRVRASRDAAVKLTLQRELLGRRNRRGTCLRSTRAPSGKRCVRRVLNLRRRTVTVPAGATRTVRFVRLAKGVYLVRAVARSGAVVRVGTVRRVRVR